MSKVVLVSSGWVGWPHFFSISVLMLMERSVPVTRYCPLSKVTSAGATSSSLAASFLPFSTISFAQACSAAPWQISEREPKVPVPRNFGVATSLTRISIRSSGMPRTSATSAGNTVSWPCPDGPALEYMPSLPSAPTRISTCSLPMPPEGSRNSASPSPRSLPFFFAALRRALKPSQSAASSAVSRSRAGSALS